MSVLSKDRAVVVRNRGIVVGECPDCCGGDCGHLCCAPGNGGPRPWGWPYVAGEGGGYVMRYKWSASGVLTLQELAPGGISINRSFNTGLRQYSVIQPVGGIITPPPTVGCPFSTDVLTVGGSTGVRIEVRASPTGVKNQATNNPGNYVTGDTNPGTQALTVPGVFVLVSSVYNPGTRLSVSMSDFPSPLWGTSGWSARYSTGALSPGTNSGAFSTANITLGPLADGFRRVFDATVAANGFASGVLSSSISATMHIETEYFPCCGGGGDSAPENLDPLLDALA